MKNTPTQVNIAQTIVLITCLAALPRITASIYTPSMPSLVDFFSTDMKHVKLSFTIYIAGLAIGQLIYGPLSDHFGRRPVLLSGLGIFTISCLLSALSPTIEWLIVARFFQATAAAAGGVIGRAIVRDLFGPDRTARALAYIAMATTLSPALGPIIGGNFEIIWGWKSTFIFMSVIGAVLLVATNQRFAETRPEREPTPWRIGDILKGFASLLRSRLFMSYAVISSSTLSIGLVFYASAPFIFIDILGISPSLYGYLIIVNVVSYILGSFMTTRLSHNINGDRLIMLGTILTAIGTGLMAAFAYADYLNIYVILGPIGLLSFAAGISMPNSMAGALNRYPQIAGTSSALSGFINMAMASAATFLLSYFEISSARPMATAMLIMAITAICANILLFRFRRICPQD